MPAYNTPLKRCLTILFILSTLLLSPNSFAMQFMDGRNANIENLTGKGRWTVFKIWASDCHICNKTIHYMEDLSLVYPEADAFGISIDKEKADAEQFIKRHTLSFPNLFADLDEIQNLLATEAGTSLFGTPTIMLYNPKGQLIAVQPGAVTAEDLARFIEKQKKG